MQGIRRAKDEESDDDGDRNEDAASTVPQLIPPGGRARARGTRGLPWRDFKGFGGKTSRRAGRSSEARVRLEQKSYALCSSSGLCGSDGIVEDEPKQINASARGSTINRGVALCTAPVPAVPRPGQP